MSRMDMVTIEHIEVKKSDIDKVKRGLKVKNNVEALKKALDIASGKIEIENLFEKYKGIKIKRVYD